MEDIKYEKWLCDNQEKIENSSSYDDLNKFNGSVGDIDYWMMEEDYEDWED